MADPLDWAPIEAVSFATNMHVDPVFAPGEDIDRVIDLALSAMLVPNCRWLRRSWSDSLAHSRRFA